MLSTFLSRSCRQLGRRTVSSVSRSNALWRALPPRIYANSFSTQLSFPDILEEPINVQPVMEDVTDEDIVDETTLFNAYDRNVQVRIMSPSQASYSSVTPTQEESSRFDQDYDQYSLHMSTFQAYNTTHEDSPHDLGLLEYDDVVDLNVVENYWEQHPEAYSDDEALPPMSTLGGDEFAPDVEDI